MKKVLLGTTALAAVSALAVTSASAQTLEERVRTLEESMIMGMTDSAWDVTVSGYLVGGFFLLDQDGAPDEDFGSTNIRWGGGEIQFLASTTLDNGMEVGGRVELENVTAGDQIDETYIYARGGFGEVKFGADDSASNLMHYSAPWFGLNGIDSPNWRNAAGGAVATTNTQAHLSGDANKITYFTPRFSGFQFGISYAPTTEGSGGGANNATRDRNDGNIHDFVSVGANFTRDLGGFSLGASAGWESGARDWGADNDGPDDDPVNWHIGGNVSAQGFTFGGAYAINEANNSLRQDCAQLERVMTPATDTTAAVMTDSTDGCAGGLEVEDEFDNSSRVELSAWSVGVKYATGPWSFSAGYFESEGSDYLNGWVDADPDSDTNEATPAYIDVQTDTVGFGATYNIGPGVNIAADLHFTEDDTGTGETRESTSGGLILGISF